MLNISNLETKINYEFKDKNLIFMALTHQSFANENNVESYERLEFLGDAIIEYIVSDFIYKNFHLTAGELTRLRSGLVSTDYLFEISKNLELPSNLQKSKSLGLISKKNSADLVESLVGSIYLDSGLNSASKFVYNFLIKSKENASSVLNHCVDNKTKLQELMQAKKLSFEYVLVSSTGNDHEKTFFVDLIVNGEKMTSGTGSSIHLAQEQCAELYIQSL